MSKFFLFIRHAFALICEDKRFSAIYIAGTSVAIASAMVIAIVLNIMLGDIPPESNRSRTLYFNSKYHLESEDDSHNFGTFFSLASDSCFRRMKCVEAVSAEDKLDKLFYWDAAKKHCIDPKLKRVQPDFFRIYDLDFVSGRPFSEKEYRNRENVCVLTEEAAKKLALMEDMNTIFQEGSFPFHVVGIVKTPSFFSDAVADIYIPYPLWGPTTSSYVSRPLEIRLDSKIKILLRKGFSRKDFLEEFEPHRKHIEAMASRRRGEKVEWTTTVKSHYFEKMNTFNFDDEGFVNQTKNLAPFALFLLLFLFLPALNLSGLVSNRMEVRRAEMGIRKAFGARRHTLLREIVNENLVLTLCGGLLGWALSWVIIHVYLHSSAAYTFIREFAKTESPNMRLDIQTFVTPTLFFVVFLCCVVLNLMAALIPAWISLRKPIVDSLNQKR